MNPWPQLLRAPPFDLRVVHDMGQPDGPRVKSGRHCLEMAPDGQLRLEWWLRAQHGVWTARCDPQPVARFLEILAEVDFPNVPQHPMTPGPSTRSIVVRARGQQASALLARYPLERTPPFEELCGIADSLCLQIRGEPIPGYRDILTPVVREVHPA